MEKKKKDSLNQSEEETTQKCGKTQARPVSSQLSASNHPIAVKSADKPAKALVNSYDVVGDIALVEIPENMETKKKEIAESIMKTHPHIRTVMEKKGDRFGEFRLRELKPIIGNETITEHKESGCRFKMDVTKAYFSPREGTERERIAAQVRPNEIVLVMFAGVGPYAIVIGKKQPKVNKIYAIEINPDAVMYMKENTGLNKLNYVVEPILGDVNDKCDILIGKCDRIIMPLPHEGRKFLDIAIKCARRKAIIHFYYIGQADDLFTMGEDLIKMECSKQNRKCKIVAKRKVLPYGPGMYKVCFDFELY